MFKWEYLVSINYRHHTINELRGDKGVYYSVYYKQQNQNIRQVGDQFADKGNNHHSSQPLHSVV